jgi:hypothetical protein
MPFNITDFKGNFPFDGARPNLFEVNIPVFDQKLTFTAKSAQLPGSTIELSRWLAIEHSQNGLSQLSMMKTSLFAISLKSGCQESMVMKAILLNHSTASMHSTLKSISMASKEISSRHIHSLICSLLIFLQLM